MMGLGDERAQEPGRQGHVCSGRRRLKGFPDAINAAFPETTAETCIVHLVRHSLNFCSWKDREAVAVRLRQVYGAETAEAAREALEAFDEKWGAQQPEQNRNIFVLDALCFIGIQARRPTASGNLPRWKPRGLVAVYGESTVGCWRRWQPGCRPGRTR